MTDTAPAPPPTRRARRRVLVGLAIVVPAVLATLGGLSLSASTTSLGDDHPSTSRPGTTAGRDGAVTEEDGVLGAGVTVFDDRSPGVANLDPDLLRALRSAATAAADHGIRFVVNSGWRSPDYQNQLLREAVEKYGSEEEAARWVATASTSAHVSGDAVDLGSADATAWLSQHGAAYGLCQIYRNEPWHYELRPEAADRGCPPLYADPTQDPRMQR